MRRWVLVVASLVLLTGCGEGAREATESAGDPVSSESPATEPTGDATSPKQPMPSDREQPGTRITVRPSDYGPMLFDAGGQAIYLFDTETTARPRCYDACAEAWPPVLTDGEPAATGAARDGLLGTTRRADGSTQVTYGGHPLYFYAHEAPGQVLCHDVAEYGGLWLVVTPNGEAAPH
jgi:predicted lipoprotein with Yx(FWY)xxD motif